MSGWYTVFCKPRGEQIAETNLNRQDYTVYLPRLLVRRRRAGKWGECIEPLFPRYLFLKIRDAAQSLAPVRSTPGVIDLVRFGGQPAQVPDQLIEALRTRESNTSGAYARRDILEPGVAVKFIDGPFRGLAAVFSKETGMERVVVFARNSR